MTGNGNYVNRLKSLKYSWNHIKWTYFRRILATWNHCVVQRKWTGGKPSTWKKQHHCVGRQPKLLKILLGLSIVSNNYFCISLLKKLNLDLLKARPFTTTRHVIVRCVIYFYQVNHTFFESKSSPVNSFHFFFQLFYVKTIFVLKNKVHKVCTHQVKINCKMSISP